MPIGEGFFYSKSLNLGYNLIRIPSNRIPTHPGEMLLEEFLIPMGISQRKLADSIHVPLQRVNEIINGKRDITPATAPRLAAFFGNTPDFWMNLQQRWDLYHATESEKQLLKTIHCTQPKRCNAESPGHAGLS
jgi:addiction module HigA family antidote